MAVKITSTPLRVTVAISGEIDHHNAAAMRYEADDAIRASLAPNVRLDFGDSVTVPEGCLFVMGDNRNGSTDSRDDRIGCVDERLVIGRAFFLLVPGGDPQHGESRDWSRIGVIS